MALTRAQLLMGNISDGTVLNGQPQGVRPGGAGITIRTDAVIEVNSQTIQGVMKLGQTAGTANAAYNQYEWPTAPGAVGQQLEIVSISGGVSTLNWADADGIDWTQKGQLLAATGAGTANETFVNVGADGSVLVADSSTLSGLNYTDQIQTAITIPSGTSPAQRPASPVAGSFRWSTTLGCLEVFNGIKWESVASDDPTVGTFVAQTVPVFPTSETGSAVIPAGTVAERQTLPAPTAGNFRWNTDLTQLEVFDGISWGQLPASSGFDFVPQTRPAAGFTASAVIPPGNSGQAETAATGGYMRYNTDDDLLEFYNGVSWELVAPSGGGVHSFVQAATPTAYNPGDIWYDTVLERESVWDGSAWVQPGVTQTSPIGAALLPVGTSGDRPAPAAAGMFRYNTTISSLEFYDAPNSTWAPAGGFNTGTRMIFVQPTAPLFWVKETGAAYNNAALRFVTGGTGNSTGGVNPFTTTFANYTPAGAVNGTTNQATAGGTVSGTTGTATAGGSVTGSVSATTLTVAEMPVHNHAANNTIGSGFCGFVVDNGGIGVQAIPGGVGGNTRYTTPGVTADQGGGGAHTHALAGVTFTGTPHDHSFNASLVGVPHDHAFTATFTGTLSTQFNVKYVDTIICTKT